MLRYQKTLLVWKAFMDNEITEGVSEEEIKRKNSELQGKLEQVKTALIEVLAEHSKGVSLAQLPIYLKKKVDFDYNLNELGFAKLKDLVNSMGD